MSRLSSILNTICVTMLSLLFLAQFQLDAFQFPQSKLAHILLDGLKGIEIGGSAHNPFGLDTLNVDYTDDYNTQFKLEELAHCGFYLKVDIVAPGDNLPVESNFVDFVISSHVIEHFYDPVKTIKEWLRVTKPGGMIYMVVPHKERTFDKDRPRTPLQEIIQRHDYPSPPEIDHHGHYSVWITADFLEICKHYQWPVVCYQNIDDKVGNGFTVVLMKPKDNPKKTRKSLLKLQQAARRHAQIPR